MKRWAALFGALVFLAGAGRADAFHAGSNPPPPMDADRITAEPAATLLLPFFKVAIPEKAGGTVSGPNVEVMVANTGHAALSYAEVHNNFATASLAKVTLWSDLGLPVLNFDVYFTGFDVVKFDLRRVIAGSLPQTATDGQDLGDSGDPDDGISNQGPISQDINYATCNGKLPPKKLGSGVIGHVRAALTGETSPMTDKQYGIDHGDATKFARGFLTVDYVVACSSMHPSDPDYDSVLGFQNMFTGRFIQTDGGKTFGDNLVHVRADYSGGTDPEVNTSGQYTFYGRMNSWTAADKRQPLATTFAARFINKDNAKTHLVVWRDPKVKVVDGFTPGSLPGWVPLGQREIIVFDDEENIQEFSSRKPFRYATQQVEVGTSVLPTTEESGWIFLNLNRGQSSSKPPENPNARQAWITSVLAQGSGPVTLPQTVLESAAATLDVVLTS